MEKYFILEPDGHYGYPEVVTTSDEMLEPLSQDELLKIYMQAGYSGYAMSDDTPEEPEPGDFLSDEEYEAAMEEYEESKKSVASDLFDDYGDYDVFHRVYFISSSMEDVSDLIDKINETTGWIIDGENLSMEDVFMEHLSKEDNINFVISLGDTSKLAIEGEDIIHIGDTKKEDTIKDIIINQYRSGKSLIAVKIFNSIKKINPSIIDGVKSELTDEEFRELSQTDMGYGLLRRLGEKRIPIQE
jgi:hypothetical protein